MIEGDATRQAVSALRGYVYQTLQSLLVWLDLPDDAELHLEVAEDFATVSGRNLDAVQVKRTAAPLTLRSKGARDTIAALWDLKARNPRHNVHVAYLTTAPVGHEQGWSLPENTPGVCYWQGAAQHLDPAPLVQALLTLELPQSLKDWLAAASPSQVRAELLIRLEWIAEAPDAADLDAAIGARLVLLGEKFGVLPANARRTAGHLLKHVLEATTGKGPRVLTRALLLDIFGTHASVAVPLAHPSSAFLGGLASATVAVRTEASPDLTGLSELPLPEPLAPRNALVTDLRGKLATHGLLWLHGMTGSGKTALAQQVAGNAWAHLNLRDLPATAAAEKLSRIEAVARPGEWAGLLIDDLEAHEDPRIEGPLARLVSRWRSGDRRLLITSYTAPSSRLSHRAEIAVQAVNLVEPLSRDDVGDLVQALGGARDAWSGVVMALTGGHPQLVAARAKALATRRWPKSALLEGIIEGEAPELEDERQGVRRRLLATLSQDARDLLYRLTLPLVTLDRMQGLVLSRVSPEIPRAAEHLDLLTGPWIEKTARGRLRISPLLKGAGADVLEPALKTAVLRASLDALLHQTAIGIEDAGPLLAQALSSQHAKALHALAISVIRERAADREVTAEAFWLLRSLVTDRPIYPQDDAVSLLLRLAQLQLTAAGDDRDKLADVTDAFFREADQWTDPAGLGLQFSALLTLIHADLPDLLRDWFERLFRIHASASPELREALESRLDGDPAPFSAVQFVFFSGAALSKSGLLLAEIFSRLESIPDTERTMWLEAMSARPGDAAAIARAAWMDGPRDTPATASANAGALAKSAALAAQWGADELAAELWLAEAILLEEYAERSREAEAKLDALVARYPSKPRTLRGRAKLYYRHDRFGEGYDDFESIEPLAAELDPVDRAYAHREGAICAARCGRWARASGIAKAGADALEAAGLSQIDYLRIGLLADASFYAERGGDWTTAVQIARRALEGLETIDPNASIRTRYVWIGVGHLIVWLKEKGSGQLRSELESRLVAGALSNPDPNEDIADSPIGDNSAYWYQLAIVEAERGLCEGIRALVDARYAAFPRISHEAILRRAEMNAALVDLAPTRFAARLHGYLEVMVAMQARGWDDASREDVWHAPRAADIPKLALADMDEGVLIGARDEILFFVLHALAAGQAEVVVRANAEFAAFGAVSIGVRTVLERLERPAPSSDVIGSASNALRDLDSPSRAARVEDLLCLTFVAADRLAHAAPPSAATAVVRFLADIWRVTCLERRFLFRAPMLACPAILAAVETAEDPPGLARLALAAQTAGRSRLAPQLIARLRELADRELGATRVPEA